MDNTHWILILYWLLFGLLHSIFAAASFKKMMQPVMGSAFKYYRPLYSFIATISLVWVLYYEFSMNSFTIPFLQKFKYVPGIPFGITGLLIMASCIRKYFFYLSGIDVFTKTQAVPTLETNGLHQYVRHPLYFGTILFAFSLLLFFPLFSNLIGFIMMTGYTVTGTYFEEKKLVEEFGKAYSNYKKNVPMLVPYFRKNIKP